MPHDYAQLREQLNNPENWKTAAVPKPDKAFGAIGPAIAGLRGIYQAAINGEPEGIAERVMASPYGRSIMSTMTEEGPGLALKGLRHQMQRMNNPAEAAHRMWQGLPNGTDYAREVIDELFPLIFGK